jgi:hypothetical protein
LYINTSHTRSSMVVDDELMVAISNSCPNLRVFKLKAVLGFSSCGGGAMHSGLSKLQVLVLHDKRQQALQQLSKLTAAAASAVEPADSREQRLRQLHVEKANLRACCFALGCSLSLLRVRRKAIAWPAKALSGLLLMGVPITACDLLQHLAWRLQQQIAGQLCDSACGLADVPHVMCCWLPPQLELLDLEGCSFMCQRGHRCFNSSSSSSGGGGGGSGSDDSALAGAAWERDALASQCTLCPLKGRMVLVKHAAGMSSNKAKGSQHTSCLTHTTAAAAAAARREMRQVLQQAVQPCVQLQRRLRGARLRLAGQHVLRPLLRGVATGSGLGLLLSWGLRLSR